MKLPPCSRWLASSLAAAAMLLGSGCGASKLSTADVQKFVDAADASARRRYAPEICEARASSFQLTQHYKVDQRGGEPHEVQIGKALYCKQAAAMARLYQYVLERGPLSISLSSDRRSATVEADYVEKMPYYEEGAIVSTPDLYQDVQIVESHDKSVVGIEDGKLKFMSTEANIYVRLVPKNEMPLPYE